MQNISHQLHNEFHSNKSLTSYDLVILINMSSAPGFLFLSGCLKKKMIINLVVVILFTVVLTGKSFVMTVLYKKVGVVKIFTILLPGACRLS